MRRITFCLFFMNMFSFSLRVLPLFLNLLREDHLTECVTEFEVSDTTLLILHYDNFTYSVSNEAI